MITEQTVAAPRPAAARGPNCRVATCLGRDDVPGTDQHLEGEEVQADDDMAAHRKRPDAWAVSWENRRLLILEFTRPNDRGELSLRETDQYKTARYRPLWDLLVRLHPGCGVEMQTYTVGI